MVNDTSSYMVDLFDVDIGFTSDYSNVLDFDNHTKREEYFDSLHYIRLMNTNLNRVQISEYSIKVSFDSSNFIEPEKINYIRTYTQLKGNANPKVMYYFVTDFTVINSYDTLTTIQFNIQNDIWTNYQFNFSFKESSVERSHMDRWDGNGRQIFLKPSLDAVQGNYVHKRSRDIELEQIKYINKDGNEVTNRVLWVIVSAGHTLSSFPDQLMFHIFPVVVNTLFTVTDTKAITYFRQNSIPLKFGSSVVDSYYPTLQMLDNSTLSQAFKIDDNDVVTIINVQLFVHLPLGIKIVNEGGVTYNKVYYTKTNAEVVELETTEHIVTLKRVSNSTVFGGVIIPDLTMFNKYVADTHKHEVELSTPVKPRHNDDYSYLHEPMLFRNPVRVLYISCKDNTAIQAVPDILTIGQSKLTIKYGVSYSATSAYNYITLYESSSRCIDNVLGFSFNLPSLYYDIISDAWYNYCVTQRDSDRQMMYANMLTGGIAETGSTAVSAGIGYRSNIERANLYDIYNKKIQDDQMGQFERLGYFDQETNKMRMNSNISNMYRSMAKQAMAMSAVGGITAFASNAVGSYISQMSKEKAMKNSPVSLATAGNVISAINNDQLGVKVIETQCDETTFSLYEDIFKKFGYAIYSVIKPNIKSRKYFNYIKTNGAILTGDVNQSILTKLGAIFDTGVTIWHMDNNTRSTLYTYNKENIERAIDTPPVELNLDGIIAFNRLWEYEYSNIDIVNVNYTAPSGAEDNDYRIEIFSGLETLYLFDGKGRDIEPIRKDISGYTNVTIRAIEMQHPDGGFKVVITNE